MSRPTPHQLRLFLIIILVFTLACDAGALGLAGPTATPFPTAHPLGPALTFTPSGSGPSAAGWIAFIRADNVFLMHPDGSGLKQVSRNPTPTNSSAAPSPVRVRWSTDGQKLAFSYGGQISVLDMANLALAPLVDGTAGGFDWAPGSYQMVYDSTLVVGQQRAYDYTNSGLWVTDARNGNKQLIVKTNSRYPAMVSPQWSLDASRVIFADPDGAEPGGQHLVDIVTGKITDLVPAGSDKGSCNWATTSLTIACTKPDPSSQGGWVLAVLDGNGNEKRTIPLPGTRFHVRPGPWSADGSKLVVLYSSEAAIAQDKIDILALDSGEITALGSGHASGWSPDARWILTDSASDPATQGSGPMTVINTTSSQVTGLADGSSPLWQPGQGIPVWQPSDTLSSAPTAPAFCLDPMILFIHMRKGYYFQICAGSQHYQLGPLEKGVYSLGPGGNFFLYATSSGYVYAARIGDRSMTPIGNIRDFIVVRRHDDPMYQFRFLGEGPDSVQVTELNYRESVVFLLPRRITAP